MNTYPSGQESLLLLRPNPRYRSFELQVVGVGEAGEEEIFPSHVCVCISANLRGSHGGVVLSALNAGEEGPKGPSRGCLRSVRLGRCTAAGESACPGSPWLVPRGLH